MKVEEYDHSEEREGLIGLIMDDAVLNQVAAKWEGEGFPSKMGDTIAQMCVDYHAKYGKAPKQDIASLFRARARKTKDEALTSMMRDFLGYLDIERQRKEKRNPAHTIDVIASLFRKTRLARIQEEMKAHIDNGDLDLAEKCRTDYKPIDFGAGTLKCPLNDLSMLEAAFAFTDTPTLVKYSGELGKMFNRAFSRGQFAGIQAPDKTGKSVALNDVMVRAVSQRTKVLFLECGDLGEEEYMAWRLAPRISGCPIISPTERWPCYLDIPIRITPPTEVDGSAKVRHKRVKHSKPLTLSGAKDAFREFTTERVKSDRPFLKFMAKPAGSLTVAEADELIRDDYQRNGWLPDAIVVDYADILAVPKGMNLDDTKAKTDENWIQLRALANKWKCLVLTATQSNAQAYDARLQNRRHFSGSKGKNAHSAMLFGMNVTAYEKDHGLMRINEITRRHGHYSTYNPVHVAGCMAIGSPFMLSCRMGYKEKEK